MKKFILILLVLTTAFANAQDKSAAKKVYFGFSIGFGGANPSELNDYVEQEYYNSGVTDLTNSKMNFLIKGSLSLTVRIVRWFDIIAIGEVATMTKIMVVSGGQSRTDVFSFNRVSPGVLANFHIPVGSKHSFFVGGGLMRHKMTYKNDYFNDKITGTTLGPRIQCGFSFNFRRFNPQICLAVDIASAKALTQLQEVELNYSGAHIGIHLNF